MTPQEARRILLDRLARCPICHVPVDDVAELIGRLSASSDAGAAGAWALIDLMIEHVRVEHGDQAATWFRAILAEVEGQ